MSGTDTSKDSDELEALFDSIVAETERNSQPVAAEAPALRETAAAPAQDNQHSADVINRLGQLTRSLHDSMRELGYDRMIEEAAKAIPDAQDRLQYVASMTEQAASRTLSATEAAQPIQEQISADAVALSSDWDRLFSNEMSVEDFKGLAARTRSFLHDVPSRAKDTNDHLLEIMMAQDFQDLTGQVIKKMMEMTRKVEQQLLELLLDQLPQDRRMQIQEKGLAGPVIKKEGSPDVVTDQTQVDDLLESLGF
ncbi:MAG: protein phosphatase CheZ [Betaproteobacteria bacterium]|nr:protein phosphatase CheZ [Betaproteobacteria bacterium]